MLSRRLIRLLLLLFVLIPAGARAQDIDRGRLDEFLAASRETIGTPGLSAAVVLDGQIVYSGGAGLADLEQDVPATADTVYRIGSISKPIAATAVMQLVEQGRVKLDEPIQRYVPHFPEKPAGTILVRHILTHTSGIRHYRDGEMLHAQRHDSLESAIGIFRDDPLEFSPGDRFQYSSYAFNLLQGVVEEASGQSFEDYLREHIWQPAGMLATRLERGEQLVPHRARPYDRLKNGEFCNSPYVDLSLKWAGGGMISTVEDLARFDLALENGTLLSPDARQQMVTPQLVVPDRSWNGNDVSMALGWFTAEDDAGRTWIWHSGGSIGARTILLRCPQTATAVILLTNCSDSQHVQSSAGKLLELVQETLAVR